MTWLAELYATHPFWIWMAVGAVFLVLEISTGTGWMLWPAACAAIVAALTFVMPDSLFLHITVWAVLSIGTAVTARRYLPKTWSGAGDPDINDNVGRLVGREGSVVEAFRNGQGRVFIDGKEWAAELAAGDPPLADGKVEVIAALGSVLKVKAAP